MEIDVDVAVVTINKCIEKIKGYSEKLENQTKELCNVLDKSQDEFLETVLGQDSETCANAVECFIDIKQLKGKITESKESETGVEKVTVKTDPEKLADMQNLILTFCMLQAHVCTREG